MKRMMKTVGRIVFLFVGGIVGLWATGFVELVLGFSILESENYLGNILLRLIFILAPAYAGWKLSYLVFRSDAPTESDLIAETRRRRDEEIDAARKTLAAKNKEL